MEFQWRLNWWYRPTQLDGFGTSVADYYDCFCDWKVNMELNSCPADEADYVEAFIQNLKSDIRLRLESKGRLSMRSLRDVFSDAQFMESLISIEDAFRKIKAKFEAHDLFDKMPNRVPADNFEDKLHPNSENNAELQETEDVSLEKTDDEIDTPRFAAAKEEALIKMDHEHSEITDSSFTGLSSFSSPVVIEDSTYFLALEALIWLFEEDEKSLPSMLEDTGNAHESPPIRLLNKTKERDESYSWGPVLHGYEVGQSHFLTVRSIKDGRHLLDEIPQLVLTSFQSIPEDSNSLFVGEGCNSATKLGVVCKVFDETPRPFSVQPNEETSGHKSYKPPVDCVPQVFDPGSVTNEFSHLVFFPRIDIEFCKGEISRLIFDPGGRSGCYMSCSKIIVFDPGDGFEIAAPIGWRFDSVSTRVHTFDKMPKQISLEQTKGNGGKVFVLIFDPGGSSLHQMGCATKHSLEQRKEKIEYSISTVLHECELLRISSQLVQTRRQTFDHQLFDTLPEFECIGKNEGRKSCEYSAVRLPNDLGYKASVMLVSLWRCISVLLLDVLWIHMINFPIMSKLGFNLQVYDPGTCTNLIGILAHSVPNHSFDHEGLTKAYMQLLLEILVKGSKIFGLVTWQTILHGPKMVVLAEATGLDDFVWDPGNFFFLTCSVGPTLVISLFLYILGDKDGFEGEGKRMICNEEMIICMEHDMRKVIRHW